MATVEGLESRLLLHAGHFNEDPPPPAAALTGQFHLRLNAGGGSYVDSSGFTWERDRIGRGGKRVRRLYDVAGTGEDALFASHRAGKLIRYAIPVPSPGTYTVNLLFADPKVTQPGLRRFNIVAEDQAVLTDFDVAASGGGRSAVVQSFPVTVSGGTLDLAFQAMLNKAVVSGIEVVGEPQPPAPSAWQEAAPLPLPLFESQGAAVGDKLYLFGGFFNEAVQATRSVFAYDPATNTWSPRAEMPVAVTHAGVAVDGSTAWVVGGLVGDYNGGVNPTTSDVWKYDTVADTWSAGPALPAAGGAGGLALENRRLHYFGGLGPDGQSDSGRHWVLDLDEASPQWRPAAAIPVARNHFGTAVVDGRIYAIGGQHGRDETGNNLRDVHVYNPANNRWHAAARLPAPMSHFHPSTAVVDGKILIAGGVTNGRTPLADVLQYDPATNRWSASDPLPAPRKAPVMIVLGGSVYVVAGSPGDNFPQATTWHRAIVTAAPASP
jgi:N-acetylneuraminic acid mutarotase